MARLLRSHVAGAWREGRGEPVALHDPTTEEVIALSSTGGLDFGEGLRFARQRGGPALRAMSFAQRGELLAGMASAIHRRRDELLELATANGGNTRRDAKFDVDGATGTLSAYARLAGDLGDARYLLDGEAERLGRSPRFVGRHVQVPLTGAAIHVNAFNFPAWGFAEKAAVALLAGMPVVTKPATSTAVVAERIVAILVEDHVLPEGALSFIAGGVGDLLDHVTGQDVIAFTGSAETGLRIRGRERVARESVRVNVEADSLNAALLGPDVEPGGPTWDLFIREVCRDVTQKAGQKCTAIRRVFAPGQALPRVREELCEELAATRVGNPARREVMGPLATRGQLDDVRAGIERLSRQAEVVWGELGRGDLVDVPEGRGWFQRPVLLHAARPEEAEDVHSHEVFGPAATLMPYSGEAPEAVRLVNLGRGGLVASVYTDDRAFATELMLGIAPFHGRLHFGSAKVAEHSPGPGTVLPQLVHGGPGRAGAGEELGGLRGMSLYVQRTALQGDEPMLAELVAGGGPP